jgi:signal transduction histidine kinase
VSADPRLGAVWLFAGLAAEDLERLSEGVGEVRLAPGETLFSEGELGDTAYVVTEGEVEILKTSGRRELLLGLGSAGAVVGEMALLRHAPRSASVRARGAATLLSIPNATLDGVLQASPTAWRNMLDVVLDRWRSNEARLRQNERMAQLGTLTAGLAHELNNPAAAVARGVTHLRAEVVTQDAAFAAAVAATGADLREELDALLADVSGRAGRPNPADAVTRADEEAGVEDWLGSHDVARPWERAPVLVDAGIEIERLDDVAAAFPPEALEAVVAAMCAVAVVGTLLREVEEGATRLSAIVKALKSYSYLDQAPVQDVDLTVGLDDTLLILKRKTEGITIDRRYDPTLPHIEAYGSELNQVWTNLIDNAADAITGSGRTDGRIEVRAFPVADGVVVEVEDNGPGIPDDVLPRIFDAFFTTKPPGSGTGLGLEITQGIVFERHGGEITVQSEPGRTVFRVELPLRPPK